jgi:hypothetical protein
VCISTSFPLFGTLGGSLLVQNKNRDWSPLVHVFPVIHEWGMVLSRGPGVPEHMSTPALIYVFSPSPLSLLEGTYTIILHSELKNNPLQIGCNGVCRFNGFHKNRSVSLVLNEFCICSVSSYSLLFLPCTTPHHPNFWSGCKQ